MVYANPDGFVKAEMIGFEQKDLTPADAQAAGDHYAHAPGRICMKCDRLIKAGQPARKRGESSWAHDVCPI